MSDALPDVARVRFDNAMRLFDEFVAATVKSPDAATLRGLERRFAERLGIQPSYWSQIKARSRQIGERLARQFEQLSRKPSGWMDVVHTGMPNSGATASLGPTAVAAPEPPHGVPQNDDERFILGLVLTYYRRHPQRARTRLLDLLGEVLGPDTAKGDPSPPPVAAPRQAQVGDEDLLWRKVRAGVAPLKPPRKR